MELGTENIFLKVKNLVKLGWGPISLNTLMNSPVVQLYESNDHQWQYTGILGTISVIEKQGFSFIQIHDLETNSLAFQLELYEGFSFEQPLEFFQTFEGEKSVLGISFAQEESCFQFAEELRAHIAKQSSTEYRNVSFVSSSGAPFGVNDAEGDSSIFTPNPRKEKGRIHKLIRRFRSKKESNREKPMIGSPTDFQHHAHLGWDLEKGFTLEGIPPEWEKILRGAGLPMRSLENPKLRKKVLSIYQEVKQIHENVESNETALQKPAPPPPPLPSIPSRTPITVHMNVEKQQPLMTTTVPDLSQILENALKEKFHSVIEENDETFWDEWSDSSE